MLLLRLLCLALCCLLFDVVQAETPFENDAVLDAGRQQLEQIGKRLEGEATDAQLAADLARLVSLQERARKIASDEAPALANAQASLTQIGAPPQDGKESADVAEQRKSLEKARAAADARIRLANLLALEAGKLTDEIASQRRSRFQARLFERTESLFSGVFWAELGRNLRREADQFDEVRAQFMQAGTAPAGVWLSLFAMVTATLFLRVWLGSKILAVITARVPLGRIRRSTQALLRALLAMLVPGVLAYALLIGFGWQQPRDAAVPIMLRSLLGATCFSSFMAGLGLALLSVGRPSWRLVPLPDSLAAGLRGYPVALAVITLCGWLATQAATVLQVGLATAVAINAVYALLLGIALASLVVRAERLRRAALVEPEFASQLAGWPVQRPPWVAFATSATWFVVTAGLLGIVIGYVALGSFLIRQLTWILVLLSLTWLLTTLIDDIFQAWQNARAERNADAEPQAHAGLRGQMLVLVSGALRLTVWLFAIVLVLAPFGEGPMELIRRMDQLRVGISVGEFQLRPVAVAQALLVFALTMIGVRALNRWLTDRFLPTTSLDAGMRTSATTLLGFIGTVIAFALGLSAIGLALDKVAWIASALSVGIGFGLQAVVSNFVSGLILLAERPVKVGDWVALGGVEGDIRRINVRATEIQMGDRSTVIVPNSEFITKVVRNVTHQNPQGLVQIKLPLPMDADTERMREILARAFAEHEDILKIPAPNVFLDGVDAGRIMFNATGFVASPRQAYGVRSALLFRVLKELHDANPPLYKLPVPVTMAVEPPKT